MEIGRAKSAIAVAKMECAGAAQARVSQQPPERASREESGYGRLSARSRFA